MNLVVLQGHKAYRYDGRRCIEEAEICVEDSTIEQIKARIEDFRKNGLPLEDPPTPIERMAIDLTTDRLPWTPNDTPLE